MADFEINGAATFDSSGVTAGIQETISSLTELVDAVTQAGAKTGAALNLAPLERAVQSSVTALDSLLTSFERISAASSNVGGAGLDQLRTSSASARSELVSVVSLLAEVNRSASGLASVDVGRIGRNLLTSVAGATTASAQALGAGRSGAGLNTQLSRAGSFALGAAGQSQASLAQLETDMKQALGGERSAMIKQLRDALVSGVERPDTKYPGLSQIPNLTVPGGAIRYNSALTGQPQELLGGKITDVTQVQAAAAAKTQAAADRAIAVQDAAAAKAQVAADKKAIADQRLADSDLKLAEAQDAAARRARVDAALGGGSAGTYSVGTKGTAFSAAEGGFVDANGRLLTSFTAVTAASKTWSAQLERLEAEQIQASKGFSATFFSSLFGSGGSKFRGGGDGGGHGGGGGLSGIADTAAVVAKYELLGRGIQSLSKFAKDSFDQFAQLDEGIKAYNQVIGSGTAANATFVNGLEDISRSAGQNVVDTLAAVTKGVAALSTAQDSSSQKRQIGQQFASAATTNAVITGQPVGGAANDIIAVATSFGIAANGISSINDAIATAHSQFGSSTLDISNGLKLLADDGKAAGYSMTELAQVVGLDAARLAESGDEVATNLQRVFAQFQSKTGQTQLQAVGVNTLGTVKTQIEGLAAVWPNLTGKQQQNIETTLGGAKAMKELLPLLNDNTALQTAFGKALNDSGAGANLAKAELNSLAGTLKVIGETIKTIALDIARTGIFDPLILALDALKPALQTLDSFLQLYDRLPEVVKGGTAALIEAALAFKAFNAIKTGAEASSVAGVFHGLFNRGGEAGAGAAGVAGGIDYKAAQLALADYTAAMGQATAATQAALDAETAEGISEDQLAAIKKVETQASADAAAALVQLAAVARGESLVGGAGAAGVETATLGDLINNRSIGGGAGNATETLLNRAKVEEYKRAIAKGGVGAIDPIFVKPIADEQGALRDVAVNGNHRLTALAESGLGADTAVPITRIAPVEKSLPLGRRSLGSLAGSAGGARAGLNGLAGDSILATDLGDAAALAGLRSSVATGIKTLGTKLVDAMSSPLGLAATAVVGAVIIDMAARQTSKQLQTARQATDAGTLASSYDFSANPDALAANATALQTQASAAKKASGTIFGRLSNALTGNSGSNAASFASAQAATESATAQAISKIQNTVGTSAGGSSILDFSSADALKTSMTTLSNNGFNAAAQMKALSQALDDVNTKGATTITTVGGQIAGAESQGTTATAIRSTLQHALSHTDITSKSFGKILSAAGATNPDTIGATVGSTVTDFIAKNPKLTSANSKDLTALVDAQVKAGIPDFSSLGPVVDQTILQQVNTGIQQSILDAQKKGVGSGKVDLPTLTANALGQLAGAPVAGTEAGNAAYKVGGDPAAANAKARLEADKKNYAQVAATAKANGYSATELLQQIQDDEDAATQAVDAAAVQHAAALGALALSLVNPFDKGAQIASQLATAEAAVTAAKTTDDRNAAQANVNNIKSQQIQQAVADQQANAADQAGYGAVNVDTGQISSDQSALEASLKGDNGVQSQTTRDNLKKLASDNIQKQKDLATQQNDVALAGIDPRNTAAVDAQTISGIKAQINATAPGDKDTLANLNKQLSSANVQKLQDSIAVANATTAAEVSPGSAVDAAAAKVKEASATLTGDLPGTAQWWTDYGTLQQAKVDLGEANLKASQTAGIAAIDTTDPVAQAKKALSDAQGQLAFDTARKAKPDVINADKNAVSSANQADLSAQFTQNIGDAQTADQLGQISHSQYLAYLKNQQLRLRQQQAGMQKGSEGYRQATDELNTLGQDILAANNQLIGQFNIGNIKVPTPYEVRRSLATQAVGQQYQSSSSNVTINVDGTNYDQVAALLGSYLGPVTTGQYTVASRKA